jgi:hypothetical protein
MIEYFESGFSYGYGLVKWFQITGLTDEKIRKYWSSLIVWYENNKVDVESMGYLPKPMIAYAVSKLGQVLSNHIITQEQYDEKIKLLTS